MAKTLLEYDPDTGKLYRTTKKVYEVDPAALCNLLSVGVTVFPMLAKGSYVVSTNKDLYVIRELTEVPMRTAFRVGESEDGKPVFVPDVVARDGGIRDSKIELIFTPPDDQILLLVLGTQKSSHHIFAADRKTHKTYYPALPNVFGNGALCTGEAGVPHYTQFITRGLDAFLNAWFKTWSDAEFNNDLNSIGTGSVERACVFDTNGKNIKLENWQSIQPMLAPEPDIAEAVDAILKVVCPMQTDEEDL